MSNKLIRFDWAMKTLLRDKANFDILEGFLVALLEDDNIKILNILESETNQDDKNDKYNRVDLLVEDSQLRKIYIEIQNTHEYDYLKSILYSTSKIIVDDQDLEKDFKDITKIISISILYFNLGTGDDYIYYGTNNFNGLNTGNQLIIKKNVNISEIFEPKYKFVDKKIIPEYYLIIEERYKNIILKRIDEWIYMIKNDEVAEGSSSKNIDKAKQKLALINMSKEDRKKYDKFLINLIRDNDVLNTAKEEGRIKGLQIGIKKRLEEGIQKKAKEMVIKLIHKQMTNQEIVEITELTILEIEQIRNELIIN